MSYSLSDSDRSAVSFLSAAGRYDYLVEKVIAGGEVWSLQSDEGWVTMTSEDDEECLPIWPHRDFAAQFANGEWADCTPASIALDVWLSRWTGGLEADGTLLVAFPFNDESDNVIVTPIEFAHAIQSQRKR